MLTDELIEDLWYFNTNSLPIHSFASLRSFVRAIEAEVRAEVCSAQNAEYAPQDCLSLTDATQVRMEAQEPVAPTEAIGKILTEVMDIACANGANSISMPDEYVEVAAWLSGIAQQSPAPCPQCAESKQEAFEEGRRTDNMRQELKERGRKIDALQAKVAEQSAEIDRLKTVPMKYRRMAFNAQLQDENKQQAERIAELESLRGQDAKACERLDELRNRDADKMAEQAALIEKCEAVMQAMVDRPKSHEAARLAVQTLAAIAAQKGDA